MSYSLADTVMQARFREIVRDHKIKVIVETGIDKGLSTVVLAGMVDTVFSVDLNPPAVVAGRISLDVALVRNAVVCLGNSPDFIRAISPVLPNETLYFLDAHWNDYWPLLDEIKAIRRGKGVIVIHDMIVPDHPELIGYKGWMNRPDLTYDYVHQALFEWSPKHRVEYNERAEGTSTPCGCGYFFPE